MKLFEKYLLAEEDGYVFFPDVFMPEMTLNSLDNDSAMNASIGGLTQTLYGSKDIVSWSPDHTFVNGVLGERMLSLVMDSFLKEIGNSEHKTAGVLRESERNATKGYIACYNDDYLLRFKDRTNFVLLQKDRSAVSEAIYMQEKFGLQSTEIDGIGYLHTDEKKYLLVGESSTKTRFNLNSWDEGHGLGDTKTRVFDPLKTLFPEHSLVYFVMSRGSNLWYGRFNRRVLNKEPTRVYRELKTQNIETIFVPMPETKPSLGELVDDISKKIYFTQSLMKNID